MEKELATSHYKRKAKHELNCKKVNKASKESNQTRIKLK